MQLQVYSKDEKKTVHSNSFINSRFYWQDFPSKRYVRSPNLERKTLFSYRIYLCYSRSHLFWLFLLAATGKFHNIFISFAVSNFRWFVILVLLFAVVWQICGCLACATFSISFLYQNKMDCMLNALTLSVALHTVRILTGQLVII